MSALRTLTRGWPVLLEMGQVLPGPPDVVWHLITDWENQDRWMLEARDFVVTSDHREGVGVEGEATVTIGGITTRDRIVVTAWEPERLLAIEHFGWVSGAAEMRLTALGPDVTHLFWQERLYPPLGALGGVGISLFKPLMQKIFERDLRVLSALTRAEALRRAS
ncbi:MAG: SRPBCC family protein [Actinomycetota bacterium]